MGSRSRGFTLIELMVVVAIVAILSISAIPFLYRMTMRTRSAEAPLIIASIRTVQLAYFGRNDRFIECAPAPDDTPVPTKRPWADPTGNFRLIGYVPEGTFHFSYRVRVNPGGNAMAIGGKADLDGDTVNQHWGYQWPTPDGLPPPYPWDIPIVLDRQVALLSDRQTY